MSEQGITVSKSEDFSEWYSQVLSKAGLVDLRYNVQGFVVHKPWLMRIIKAIYRFFEEELEKTGHEPVLFPLVIPEENFEKEKEHVEGFKPEVFWVTQAGDEKLERRLALRPTSETAFYYMYSYWIQSWRDLPLKLYQSVSVYRNEKNTRPLIRGREFLWIEAHDAFATHEEALNQIREDMENSRKVIWEKLGIPFLFLRRPPWDKFSGAEDTYAADTIMPDGRVLQISSTHDLGQRFAKAFNVTFLDKDGKRKYVWQTCYGPGIWRITAALIAIHGDDKGLVLPMNVAPIQVVIVPIYYKESDKERVLEKCRKLEAMIREAGYRVYLDAREEYTPGWKFNDWELKGVPVRLEVGVREVETGTVTVFRRDLRVKEKVADSELISHIRKLENDILEELKRRAKEFFESRIVTATRREEVEEALRSGKMVKMPFCGREECADDLKEATDGGKVRGTEIDFKEGDYGRCAWCGAPARLIVYVAKSY
ncbi:proline--tRNA ligase [Thermofilum pendens]|uniref:Proline--tRNA ligase n=1 Tax=Thermofilum pendens (strain DSM 2475 / Hrk 5) TaxID=368408 RepID=SYP_THEPD|nr:proline--tRNA ligase [Thermofilum pendens]A1RYD8.1 RecName: Full=Proline--tRNA ligase; AltName: Full=Prolyl-tRNA synthetase; Short=ProRS [Thermofilum pendens Hrk 5]ABL78218.1 prolyl-tRNA synthetase [Thermofilum pendens Hrk 5]